MATPNPFDQFDASAARPAVAANPFDQFDAQTEQTAPKVLASVDQPDTWGNAVKNVGQAGLSIGSGLLSTPLAGLAGLGTMATNALGLTDTPAASVVDKVSSALTYKPRTERAEGVVKGVTYPLRKLAEFADTTGDQINSQRGQSASSIARYGYLPEPTQGFRTGAATAVNTGIQASPAVLMRGRAAEAPKAAEQPKAPPIDPRAETMKVAQAAGLKFTPSQAKAPVGTVAEGMTGQAKLERSLSLKNAPVVNTLAAKELGLAEDTTITPARITELKVKANRAYSDVAKTGKRTVSDEYRKEVNAIDNRTGGDSFKGDVPPDITKLKEFYSKIKQFSAEDAVNKIRQLRTDATSNIKARNAPEQNAKGYVQRAIADALDNELARHVETLGKPELVAKYKEARVQLAKVHSVEDALRGGNISAKALAQQLKRGVPLSGNLKLIAQTYGEFEKVLQDVSKVRDGHPFSVVDAFMGVAGAAHSPPLAAAVLARPAVRAYLASGRYQRGLVKPSAVKATPATPQNGALKSTATANVLASERDRRRAAR